MKLTNKLKKMEKLKVKIRTNEFAVDDQMAAIESLKNECTKLVEPFNTLGLGMTTELLRDAVTGSYQEIRKVIQDQLKNDLKTVRLNIIREGMENEAKKAISLFRENCEKILRGERRDLVKFLEVLKGQVNIAAGSLEAIQEQNTYYLTDAKEIEAYNAHLVACEAVNKFLSIIDRKPQVIWQIFKYHTDICQVEPADFNYGFMLNSKN